MKRCYLILSAVIFLSLPLHAQTWGAGIRLGDPSGLTLKKYLGNKAWELNIGRTHFGYGRDWYGRRFYDWYDDRDFPYDDFRYDGYRRRFPLAVQLRYLIQKDIRGAQGLEWYYGLGGQVQFHSYYFNYRYKPGGGKDWVYVSDERVFDIDLGADLVIGLEYTFKDAPISLFLDASLFMEVLDDPFLFWPQAGIGGRFRF